MQAQSVTMHQQPVAMHQQTVTMAVTHPTGKQYETFQAKSSVSLGALQIIIGMLCIIFNVAAIAVDAALSPVGHGIWGGLFFILAGSFGVSAGKYRTSCPIVAFMVLSIIAAVLTIFVLAFSAAGADDDNESYCYWGFCWYEDPNSHSQRNVGVTYMLLEDGDREPDYLRKNQAPRGGSIAEGLAIGLRIFKKDKFFITYVLFFCGITMTNFYDGTTRSRN